MRRPSQSRFDNRHRSRNPPALLRAPEAIALLGIKRATLYSYVSRGWVRAIPDPDRAGNLYDREDLERLRQRHDARAGHGAVAAGALSYGEPILATAICQITDAGPSYRGRPAIELASGGASFESVCELLWGDTGAPARWGLRHGARRYRVEAPPLLRMLAIAADAAAAGQPDEPHRLLLELAGPPASSLAEALALSLGLRTVSARVVDALNQALVLCADHELTASTFAARIAASTGATLWASLCAGLATLTGPRHGGAPPLVSAFVDRLTSPAAAPNLVAETLRLRQAIPGFGHPLYPGGDPRGAALLALARAHSSPGRLRSYDAIADATLTGTGEHPSLDFGLAALAQGLRLAPEAATAIFGLGRSAGLIAHALEQRRDGRLLRPRARYLAGPESPRASNPLAQSAPPPPARDR